MQFTKYVGIVKNRMQKITQNISADGFAVRKASMH